MLAAKPRNEGPHRLDLFKLEVLVILLIKHQEDVESRMPVGRLVDLRLVVFGQQFAAPLLVVDGRAALGFRGTLQRLIPGVAADEIGKLCLHIGRGKRAGARRQVWSRVDLQIVDELLPYLPFTIFLSLTHVSKLKRYL